MTPAPEAKPPLPPYTRESAIEKARLAENTWNSRDPVKVSLAYTPDSWWRNRSEFLQGRTAIVEFLTRKWEKELDYRLIKELWAFDDNRISARFQYEYRNAEGQWFRAHGNEQWEFDEYGLMRRREASINDVAIKDSERKFFWDAPGPRPDDHPGLSELGL
ncbi:MAG: nuclear transport factor 2 family protein [Pseudomonadota bacterium]